MQYPRPSRSTYRSRKRANAQPIQSRAIRANPDVSLVILQGNIELRVIEAKIFTDAFVASIRSEARAAGLRASDPQISRAIFEHYVPTAPCSQFAGLMAFDDTGSPQCASAFHSTFATFRLARKPQRHHRYSGILIHHH